MSSSSPSQYQQDDASQTSNCDWTINVTDCFAQEYFQVIYGITTYLSLFVFLCSIWLLSWRLYNKPEIKLFRIKGFLTLEGYLFIQIFWGIARVISCVILIYNLFPGQWIVREVVLDVSWFIGLVSVITYLAGVLRTIPRMYFYRQNSHYKRSLHRPNLYAIAGVYISYIIIIGTIRITCAVFKGYFHQYPSENSNKMINIIGIIYYCTCSISALLVAIGFLIYGNKLVGIASEGLHLLESVDGYPSRSSRISRIRRSDYDNYVVSELEIKHKKLQRSVRKMHIINMAFILSFVALSIILGVFAFLNKPIINNIEISKVLAAITNLMPMILNVLVMGGITYGEMRVPDKSEPRLENIMIPTFSNLTSDASHSPTMKHESSDGKSLFHSRNNSTDSDAPLLRRPAPVKISSRRDSTQLDSPISVASSSSPVIGTFALASSSTSSRYTSTPYTSAPHTDTLFTSTTTLSDDDV
ncbi:hypothetical protein C1645_760374 [Glomus cerebriforme]|uniref:Uncharacterized protein n=1 Tax=Glomus cerebriforme TaxID=658196 RepID=A0A397TBM3_9GLOM|nr:hypothetical protein C1645_760374 [Glomus cerebriforme]